MTHHGIVFWAVDVQNDFMTEQGHLYVPDAEYIRKNIQTLTHQAYFYNIPLLGSIDWHPENDPEFEIYPPHCIQNTSGAEIIPEAEFYEGKHLYIENSPVISQDTRRELDFVLEQTKPTFIQKQTVSVFKNPIMDQYLVPKLQDKVIVIYGVATDICVAAAAKGFLKRGFEVIIIDDAIAGVDPEATSNVLIKLQIGDDLPRAVSVKSTQEFITYLQNEPLIMRIQNGIREFLSTNSISAFILGVSGGIDSALTAALLNPVCQERQIPLIGVWIGIDSNTSEEYHRAQSIASEFCNEFIDIDLTKEYRALAPSILSENDKNPSNDAYFTRVRKGNIKARMRMIYLYNLAHERHGVVMATGNKTEVLLGFSTLHGDVGDFNLLSHIYKSEVYQLAQWIADKYNDNDEENKADSLQECINAIPTDGLGISTSDMEQLITMDEEKLNQSHLSSTNITYLQIDNILQNFIHNNRTKYSKHPIIQRYFDKAWKRRNPVNLPYEFLKKGSFF